MELDDNPPDTARRTLKVGKYEECNASTRQCIGYSYCMPTAGNRLSTYPFSWKDYTVFTQHGTKLVYEIFLKTAPKKIWTA